ncbi:hypothetical protein DIPPA_30327 [Diplonema papillatum]|nr:hypothetical protein DIPPA_30327 [Diplonema papillatum]
MDSALFRSILNPVELARQRLWTKEMVHEIGQFAQDTEELFYRNNAGADVFLLLDGATVRGRLFLGFAVSNGKATYFLKSAEVRCMTAASIEREVDDTYAPKQT